MNDRIKKLRKTLDLTQEKFGSRISVRGNTVAQWESGRNEPPDSAITFICREFNVSEEWLRNGTGDMFQPSNRNTDLARLTKQLLNEESDSFKNRFISMLSKLSVEEWEFLERKAEELCGMQPEAPTHDGE